MPTTMTLRLDAETRKRLEKLARATDRSKAYLAMQALEQYLDIHEWQVGAIQQAVDEADAAAADDFVDNDAVMNWIDSWGTNAEKEPPA